MARPCFARLHVVRRLLLIGAMSRLLLAALLAGCTSSPSPTGLQPQILLNSFDAQLRVNIGLQTRTPIDVSASYRGQTIVDMTSTEGVGNANASGALLLFDLDHPIAGEEPVTIEIDGIRLLITAPPPFDSVQVPPSISRSRPGSIGWATTSSDAMRWLGDGTCANGSGDIAPGAASVTIAMTGDDPTASCPTTVRLYRDRTGTLDRAFEDSAGDESGYLEWEQVYDASFTSTP